MRKALRLCFVVAGVVCAGAVPAAAQEMIHALTGTVTSIDPATKSITVLQDNGTTATFNGKANKKTQVAFDKRVAAESTAAGSFDKNGAYVIVFYYGMDDRTVVALKSLGAGPFTATTGTLKKMDKHSLTLTDSTGATQTFKIDPQTVGEGMYGVTEADKMPTDKGMNVRVVAAKNDGMALFVRAM